MRLRLLESNQTIYRGYHGSKSDFDRFNHQFIGAHGMEHGWGLYFTDNIDLAKTYGDYIIQADLVIRNAFSNDSITITKEQVKEYIKKYIDNTGEGFLSQYPYEVAVLGYEKVLDNVVNDLFLYTNSDVDILSEILPFVQNKYTDDAYDAIYTIFKKDGIIYVGYDWDGNLITNYVVYSNSQITNKKKIKI